MEPIFPDPSKASAASEESDNRNAANDALRIFDQTYGSNHLTLLKILSQVVPVRYQAYLAFYIRFQELQITMQKMNQQKTKVRSFASEEKMDIKDILPRLPTLFTCAKPYLSEEESSLFSKLSQMLQLYETYQSMAPYLSMMEGMDLSSLTSGMNLDMEQFDMLRSLFQESGDK